jgi:hypothetical protein
MATCATDISQTNSWQQARSAEAFTSRDRSDAHRRLRPPPPGRMFGHERQVPGLASMVRSSTLALRGPSGMGTEKQIDAPGSTIGPPRRAQADRSVSAACPGCGSAAVRPSHWRPQDGMLRLLFCSAVRCHSCGRRQFHFSPWGVAATVAVVLLIVFLVGVFILAFWGDAR